MKVVIFSLFAGMISCAAWAQSGTKTVLVSHYVFPAFIQGTVQLKSGVKQEPLLNYNSLTQEMIFEQNGKRLALAQPESVDTVYIQNRKFIPAGKLFYEVLTNTSIPLLTAHTCRISSPGTPSGYGTTTQTSPATSYAGMISGGRAYDLKLPDEYKAIPETAFVLRKDTEYIKIKNARQFANIFPEKADAIKQFVKENKTDFNNQEDIKALVLFLQ